MSAGTAAASEWFDRPGGERVRIVPSRADWRQEAQQWCARLAAAVGDAAVEVAHIGSTAVPGLAAKPVLDIQLSVLDLEDEDAYRPQLESLGLVLRQRDADHRFFRPPAGAPRTVHVHVCARGSRWESEHLRFRDVLRTRPDLVAEYAILKRRLAESHADDRGAYNRGKAAFIAGVLGGRGDPR